MAKKPLTGTTKLAQTPVAPTAEPQNEPLPLKRKRPKTTLKNFRLSPIDVKRLQEITNSVNEASDRFISETAVIKGLIYMAEKTNTDKLIKLIKEA